MLKDLRYSFSEEGEWWLPKKPDNRIVGILSYNPSQGLSLDLKGGRLSIKNVEIIQGDLYGEGKCTLLDCQLASSTSFPDRVIKAKYLINYALLGFHFNKVNEITFLSATMHFTNLANWVRRKRFIRKNIKGGTQYTKLNLKQLNYKIPLNNTSLKISPLSNSSSSSYQLRESHNECLTIRPKTKNTLSWYLDISTQLTYLLAILMQKDIYPIKTILEIRRKSPDGKFFKIYIDCITQIRTGKDFSNDIDDYKFLFDYSSLKETFQDILDNWFKIYQKLKPVLDLYFDNFIYEQNNSQLKFLTYTQSLEAFHRTFFKNEYISEIEYKPIYDILESSIPKSISRAHRDSLKSKIKYGYEYSLRTRLKDLFKYLNKTSIELITDDQSQFINKLVNTRNYLTHLDKNLANKAMSTVQLYRFNYRLEYFILILILKELKLPEDFIVRKMKINSNISTVLRLINFPD